MKPKLSMLDDGIKLESKNKMGFAFARRTGWFVGALMLAVSLVGSAAQPLQTVEEAPCRDALEAKIEKAKNTVTRFGGGHVVIGRVVLDEPDDPRDVIAQMDILPGGYFAGATKDLSRPICFRMHQYAPLDIELKGFSGEIVDIGTTRLKRVPSPKLASLEGRIEHEGGADAVSAKLSVMCGSVNTPHNGSEPRGRWPAPIKADVHADGTVSASGFSPMRYYCSVEAPGYLKQSFPVHFEPGRTTNIGTIQLARPLQLNLNYVVAEKPPFDLARKKQTVVAGGERWKCAPDIYGWDLEFTQRGNDILLNSFYGPCMFQDLGPGTLEEMIEYANRASAYKKVCGQRIENGFIYIIHQGHWKRWILLKIEIAENQK